MSIEDIIGKGKAFEPSFRRRGINVKDKNLRTLLHVKAYGTLLANGIADTHDGSIAIADHIVELLNERWKDEPYTTN